MPPKSSTKAQRKTASNATPRNTRSGTKRNASTEPAARKPPARRANKGSTATDKTENELKGKSASQVSTPQTHNQNDVNEVSGPSNVEAPLDGSAKSPAILSGKFDIYAMELPFLSKVYLAKGSSNPQYEELYKTILTYQAKPDFTAQCALPDLSITSTKSGSLTSSVFLDPMSDERYDIGIESLKSTGKISYTAAQRRKFVETGAPITGVPGIVANLSLRDAGCGIASSKGDFRMSRLWTKEENGKLDELFEGILSISITYSGLYKRKGHGSGFAVSVPFWAVRARRDKAGKEIGPECEDSRSGRGWVDHGNDNFDMSDGEYDDESDSDDSLSGSHGMGYGYFDMSDGDYDELFDSDDSDLVGSHGTGYDYFDRYY